VLVHSGPLEQRGDQYHGAWVPVRLESPTGFHVLSGLVDTGADQTLVPRAVIAALGFARIGTTRVSGVVSEKGVIKEQAEDTFRANEVEVGGYRVLDVEVTPYDRDFVLVGRDILNDLVLHYDGPRLAFTLTDPSPASP
jgi:predicted aspartyl protease